MRTRLLIVDDSALYRQTISNVLRDATYVEVVGIAKNGVEALEKIRSLNPDLLTLDVQMPDMDGISVLREMNRLAMRPGAIMVSSLTSQGAQVTTDALIEGAFDFILKPSGGDPIENFSQLRESLAEKIAAFREAHRWRIQRGRRREETTPPVEIEADDAAAAGAACRAVLIGTSTGGPAALRRVLPHLPADLPVPVLIVQHMPPQYTNSLAGRLDEASALHVAEAADGTRVEPGTALIAPGGRQMNLVAANADVRLRVNDDPPENGCRPAADYLFRSAVEAYDGQVLCVIMTGMGRDGTQSCQLLKSHGASVFAQHQDGCTVYGMPKAVIDAGLADRILPLNRIGGAIVRHVRNRHRL